jgi:arabinofuranosyltransferase
MRIVEKIRANFFPIFLTVYTLTVLIAFPKWTVDDAYIAFRFAENLVHHSVLTWNVGEEAVEGYTGVALPVILALFFKIGVSPVLGSHIIGVFSFLLGGFILYSYGTLLGLNRKIASFPFQASIREVLLLLYFTAPFMYTHAFSGLETVLFTTFILTSTFFLHKCTVAEKHQALLESILLLILLVIPRL